MPGAVARTSTFALNNATLSYTLDIANKGYKKALEEDKHLLKGLNVAFGKITHEAVTNALGGEYVEPLKAI
jgi:alanine dehydrogenase